MTDFKVGDTVYFIHDTPEGYKLKHGVIEDEKFKTVYKVYFDDVIGYTHVRKQECFSSKQEVIDSL